jgi:hypothetical protein
LVAVKPDGSPEWSSTFVTVQPFVLASSFHQTLNLPMVERSAKFIVLQSAVRTVLQKNAVFESNSLYSQDIVAAVNFQHDCERGKCKSDGAEVIREEREATTRTRQVVTHSDDTHYLVNVNALHNYKTIAAALPPNLRKSSFKIDDIPALYANASAQVREKKRQQTEEKKQLLIAKASNRSKPQSATEPDILPALTDGDLLDVLEAVLVDSEPIIDVDPNEICSEETIGTSGRPFSPALVPALEAPDNQRASKANGGPLYVPLIFLILNLSITTLALTKFTGRKLRRMS